MQRIHLVLGYILLWIVQVMLDYDTSIAIDSNNKVHISYYDGTNDDLKYATNVIWFLGDILPWIVQ